MEKILVTGSNGFIGSHLVELLIKEGHSVIAFDRYNSDNNLGWLENSEYKNDIEFILGDIRDFDSVNRALSSCNIVFHLAALIGIPYSYVSPLAYLRTNVEGTYNILESSRNNNIDQVLITSTSEVYGTALYIPIDEKHQVVGQSPYAASKIGADQLSLSYFKSFDLPIKIVRPFNTYGPRQSSRAIIPTIITQILNNQKSIQLGNVTPTRDLTYVDDTIHGFYSIYKTSSLFGEVTNIGMNDEISIEGLINKISNLMNKNLSIEIDNDRKRPDKSEVNQLVCDNTKLINNSGWAPNNNLDDGLIKTIDWIQNNLNYFDSFNYTI